MLHLLCPELYRNEIRSAGALCLLHIPLHTGIVKFSLFDTQLKFVNDKDVSDFRLQSDCYAIVSMVWDS